MWVVAAALVFCLGQAFLKGWFSLLLLPASLLVLPLEFVLQRIAINVQRRRASGYLRLVRLAQLASLVAVYTSLVGFGDTDDVLLFGFKTSVTDSRLTELSWTIFGVATTALPILTVWLIVAVVRRRGD